MGRKGVLPACEGLCAAAGQGSHPEGRSEAEDGGAVDEVVDVAAVVSDRPRHADL